MATTQLKKLRIFAASPSDVTTERAVINSTVNLLKPFADSIGILLDVYDWLAVVPDMGRPQQVIFDQLKPESWDIFVGILWSRFGTRSGGVNSQTQKKYLSGTEEEFLVAYSLWQQFGRPRLMIYRCTRSIPYNTDPDQLKRVQSFFKKFEASSGEHPGLVQTFDSLDLFKELLFKNFQSLLLGYAEAMRDGSLADELIFPIKQKNFGNLPRRDVFFGREEEIQKLLNSLQSEDRSWGRMIDGIGGIGKTGLAIEVAYRCQEKNFFDAYIFVSAKRQNLESGGIKEIAPVAATFNEFISVTSKALGQMDILQLDDEGRKIALLDHLRNIRVLLVYDNLETLPRKEHEALLEWLQQLPQGSKAILTSRFRGSDGAKRLRLKELDFEVARAIILNELEGDESLRHKFQNIDEECWHELYDLTGGSPLALKHIINLMRVHIALTFDNALALLRNRTGDADLLRFVYQEASKELDENDWKTLHTISFFSSSVSFKVLQSVMDLPRQVFETSVERLHALSLINILTVNDHVTIHPLTRVYIHEHLGQNPNKINQIIIRVGTYWIAYVQEHGGLENRRYDLLELEWPNINTTIQYLIVNAMEMNRIKNKSAAHLAIKFIKALHQFLFDTSRTSEGFEFDSFADIAAHILGIPFIRMFTDESSDERTDVQLVPTIKDGFISQEVRKIHPAKKNWRKNASG